MSQRIREIVNPEVPKRCIQVRFQGNPQKENFSISDIGSTRGQRIVAPRFAKFRNANSRKHRRSIASHEDRAKDFGNSTFWVSEVVETRNSITGIAISRNPKSRFGKGRDHIVGQEIWVDALYLITWAYL
jgi:hypothetical protein